jgi:hypothetical protein
MLTVQCVSDSTSGHVGLKLRQHTRSADACQLEFAFRVRVCMRVCAFLFIFTCADLLV